MKKFIVLFVLLLASFAEAQTTQVFKRFAVQSATGQTVSFQFALGQSSPSDQYTVANGFVPTSYTITITPTGSPATCTYRVLGSLKLTNDNPVFSDFSGGDLTGDINCTTQVTVHVARKPYISLIGNLLTLTGGTSPTVQLSILATK